MRKELFGILLVSIVACTPIPDVPDEIAVVSTDLPKSSKRGVSFNFSIADDAVLLSPYISWNYNWGPDITDDVIPVWFDQNQVEFCPMAWNQSFNATRIREYAKAHPQVRYLLGFNEPNLKDQCNLTPAQAAHYWPRVVRLAKELNLKLVSPAMNYGTLEGYSDPIKWLDEFFAIDSISIDDIDAISVHAYMGTATATIGYLDRFRKYGKPVWLTEFCAWEPIVSSVESQMSYMCTMLNYLEQSDLVERYAWFIPRFSMATSSYPYMQLLTKTAPYQLTDLGKLFCSFSSMDKSVWLDASQPVSAEKYVSVNDYSLQVRNNPLDNSLMLYAFSKGQKVDYQIYLPASVNQLKIEYAALAESEVLIYVDGQALAFFSLPKTGDVMSAMETCLLDVPVLQGTHTVSFEMSRGTINLNKFSLL